MQKKERIGDKIFNSKERQKILKQNITEYVLEVRVSNHEAVSLYQSFDFKIEGVKKKYYKDGENAYYMVYKINYV